DTRLKRTVALKFLPPHLTGDPEAKARFVNEAQAASALDHPNICTIHQIDETDDGQLFIVMAYYEGETLREAVSRGQYSVNSSSGNGIEVAEAIEIAGQVAAGLACAHAAGITHRDIKPANIFITKQGVVKILDFGMAKLVGQILTKSGEAHGTVAYMSPEQAQARPTDHRTDIWSLGVILYEMLTGEPPFKGEFDQVVMYAIVNDEPEPASKLRPEVPEDVAVLVDRLLEKNPDARPQDATSIFTGDPIIFPTMSSKAPDNQRRFESSYAGSWISKATSGQKTLIFSGIALFILMAIFAGYYWKTNDKNRYEISLAIMPFENSSGNAEEEYLIDGMTEELIGTLSKTEKLRVIARTTMMRYKNTDIPLTQINEALNVDLFLRGSVMLEEQDVQIKTQLLEAATGRQLWQKSYAQELGNITILYSEIADDIMQKSLSKITTHKEVRLDGDDAVHPQAYKLYLQGRDFENKWDNISAANYFEQAIAIDSTNALFYAGLARSLHKQTVSNVAQHKDVYPKLKKVLSKAAMLDSTLAEVQAALGAFKFNMEWQWYEAEKHYKRAIALNPNSVNALIGYAFYLVLMGRFDEGIALNLRAIELDPLSPFFQGNLGWSYIIARRFQDAILQLNKVLDQYPRYGVASRLLAGAFILSKTPKNALLQCNWLGNELICAYAHAMIGSPDKALAILEEILYESGKINTDPFWFAPVYAALGDKDEAFAWLEKAYQEHSAGMVFIKVEPKLDSLRDDPRFMDLLRRVGLQE
ncbi:MAG: protein kinase, partial [bacterium]